MGFLLRTEGTTSTSRRIPISLCGRMAPELKWIVLDMLDNLYRPEPCSILLKIVLSNLNSNLYKSK